MAEATWWSFRLIDKNANQVLLLAYSCMKDVNVML